MSNNDLKAGGRLALTIGGAYFGPVGAIAGTVLGNFLLPADNLESTGPRLQELQVSLSRYGEPIKIVFGSARIGGTYPWATDIIEKVSKKTESAKGGQKTTVRTFSYFGNFAVDLCESPPTFPITSVPKIWANADIIIDRTSTTGASTAGFLVGEITGALFDTGTIRVQLGAEDQQPDPLIESFVGVGNTPAGRGVCRIIADEMPLANTQNIIPQINGLVTTGGADKFPKDTMSSVLGGGASHFFLQDRIHFVAHTRRDLCQRIELSLYPATIRVT